MHILPREQQIQVIAALTEGCSIRATERLTGVHRDTIMRLGVKVGEGCRRLHDARMRGLQVNLIEVDEQWAFIQKKAKRVVPGDPPEFGDCYVFVALDATSKAVLTYLVGKRTGENAATFCAELRARVVNRPQITADGWPAYPNAMEFAFGTEVDFATIVKSYSVTPGNEAAVRYSPGNIRGIEKEDVIGHPDQSAISTSYVERFNLTTRMQSRRFTRLTNGFSRKVSHHAAAIALQFAQYNWCRWHQAIRCTPAMALGVTDHIWSIGELIDAALSNVPPTPLPTPTLPQGMSASKASGGQRHAQGSRLYVITGGKGRRK